MKKILIVEDEKPISNIIKFHLKKSGYETLEAYDGESALKMAESHRPDLVLLDIMIPKLNGFEVCSKLRSTMHLPIIMLTAKDEMSDKILGLSLGADDYISKPFEMREVLARIDANLRRIELTKTYLNSNQNADEYHYGKMTINRSKFEVTIQGENVHLTTREYELLEFLSKNASKVYTRDELMKEVWGYEYFDDDRTVDVTISRLRDKLREKSDEKHILTKRGFGYYFE